MLMTFGLELTSLVNSDPAWKVPKGSRSASRRARKTVCDSLKNCSWLINRSSESSNMPVSGSEKRGASMVDCRFSEKAEHIPIKKRRFLLRSSPSPPPPVIFSPRTEAGNHTKSHDASEKCADVESVVSDINSSQIIDNTVSLKDKKSEEASKSFGESEDFSGISILAAAACSSSLGRDCSDTKDGFVAEESSPQGQAREISPVLDTHLSTTEILKEDLPNSSEMPTGGALSCAGTEPVGELVSNSTSVNSSENVAAGKGAEDNSLKVDPLTVSVDASCSKDEEIVGSQKQCSRDDRFHWDLNVMMDAWEEPFEPSVDQNDIPPNTSQEAGKSRHDKNIENLKVHDLQFRLASTCAVKDCVLPGEPKTLDNQSLEENKLNLDISSGDYVVQPANLDEKRLLSNCNKNLNIVSEDYKFMCHNRITKPSDRSFITALDPASHLSASGTANEDDDVCVKSLKLNDDEHPKARPNLESLNLSTCGSRRMLENVKSSSASDEMQQSLCVSSSSAIWPDLSILGSMKTYQELWYDSGAVAENGGIKTAEALQQPQVASGRDDVSHSSMCVEGPNSLSTKCEVLAALDVKEQDFGFSKGENDTTVKVSDTSSLSKETCEASHDSCSANLDKSFNCLGKFDAAQAPNHNDYRNVCCHPNSAVGTVAKIELQEAYDSQYEDGEVREPNEHPWEGYDVLDREVEHVDYESDDMGACTVNPTGYLVSESGQVEDRENCGPEEEEAIVSAGVCNVDNEVNVEAAKPVQDYGPQEEENRIKSNPQSEEKMKESGSKELLAGRSSSSDMDIGVSDDEGRKERLASHADEPVDSKCAERRVESKSFRRALRSRIEGPVAHDTSTREGRVTRMESRYEESSSMRSFERTRYSFHNQDRGRPADGWDGFSDNRRGFRRHYSPIMHRHSRLDDDANMERDDLGYAAVQVDVSYSNQFLPKSRSGGNEDDCAGLHSRCRPNRTFSPGRPSTFGRGRSVRYGSLFENRAGRGRYSGPSSDDSFQSSLKYRRPLSQRERSFSPFGGRGHSNTHHSRGKSPSQSRSRSPIMWNSPRGRTGAGRGGSSFVRRRIRSPNFGTDVRMQRLRSAHHQPGFVPDDAVGFRSIPRIHGSPPHGRWNSAGKEEVGHFRDFGYKQRSTRLERSPGRIRLRGDRAGIFDLPRDLKSDGCYRISDDASSRGPRYEENYDGRRKHYGPLRPARPSYEDNMAGRLHQDIGDGFSMSRSIRDRDVSDFQGRGLRGMDNRINDLPRRFRGEQHSFMCGQDGKFNSNSKQFGVDIMDSSSNLKSEEQYQSYHAGRFTDMDGVNRECRYGNFDRRKQYDAPNVMKRCDADGLEMRLNQNLDEKFQDASYFCGRPMRSFDGRMGSLSTRLREDKDSAGGGQEKKLEDNPQ